ncbi:uncharacterized protein [Nicotiana sylvestris]|uniref:uncharacterized protein n=1 Tax=Nicotiana sylvestris TaxID=4096 RepID=UPI00388CDBCB
MNTVAPHLFSRIVYASDAHHVWEDLRERLDKVNRVRIFQLHQEIATISQGTDSVSMYFTRLKELWVEYDAMVPSPNCGCLKSKENVEHFLQQRLLQFLIGLNYSHDQSRRQILMKTTEPTLNQAYAMIIESESQLTPTSGVNAIVKGMTLQYYGVQKYYLGNYSCGVYNQGYNTNRHRCFPGGEHRDSNLISDGNQGFDPGQGIMNNVVAGQGATSMNAIPAPMVFTQEQYNQILKMLNKGDNTETEAATKTTRIVTPSTPNNRNDKWIVDSGATNHMVGDSCHVLSC